MEELKRQLSNSAEKNRLEIEASVVVPCYACVGNFHAVCIRGDGGSATGESYTNIKAAEVREWFWPVDGEVTLQNEYAP